MPAMVTEGDENTTSVLKKIDAAIEPGAASMGKILVIDDDATARQLLTRVLEERGYEVITAEGGEQGIALAKSENPALITCDILMPNVDGWEVLQSLKDDAIPLIVK